MAAFARRILGIRSPNLTVVAVNACSGRAWHCSEQQEVILAELLLSRADRTCFRTSLARPKHCEYCVQNTR